MYFYVYELRFNIHTGNTNRRIYGKYKTFEDAEERYIKLANMGLKVLIVERK